MKLIDIEADFYTAVFCKEILGYSMVEYLKLYYEGSQVFMDKWIRKGKLERYIGTILSLIKMFINFPKTKQRVNTFDLYLLSISPLYTEENLHVLVVRKEHIYFDYINAKLEDFIEVEKCYVNIYTFTFKGYVEKIVTFAIKAINLTLPQKIENEIKALK